MRYSISNTAEYGDFVSGPRVINDQSRIAMKQILEEIQTGKFARDFILENQSGTPVMKALRRRSREHQIEVVGAQLRSMMPWIAKDKLVDKDKN